ncbi:hypothetical protein N7462_000452 [Penicillium macrosclerotiorum]|uniref:uncharacterized protein n=1 Tax=Penicillium macrosclerotiorum TaxID=303699 RepID=UPI002547F2E3|nr:uncharacterized protein N7462_000452 [Penicillium macrosclerotiorum]KAJ5698447.1 hypothetical protein N7462_000452 [Penicillium macrosclerotiorum]
MATQAALIADTIVGMKRALRRERDGESNSFDTAGPGSVANLGLPRTDSGPDDAIIQPTNRGNKMKANAKYVREGALGYINAEEFYKEKIEHAGYTRHILQRNPIRYDSEGDELDEEAEDSEADAAAAEENPFSGIALETLMCPLKHPSELPSHPSLSQPYTSQAMEDMTQAVEEKLRQERALLWRARNLHRQFLGDGGWMPCGTVETLDDRYIFEPRTADDIKNASLAQQRISESGTPVINESLNSSINGSQGMLQKGILGQEGQQAPNEVENNVEMTDAPEATAQPAAANDVPEPLQGVKSEETDAAVKDLPQHSEESAARGNNISLPASQDGTLGRREKQEDIDISKDGEKADTDEALENETEQDEEMQDGSSPEPPRRMTTRAQTNAVNLPEAGNQSPTFSTDSSNTLLVPHPLFLIPENVRPDANFGLPATEAEETRRLLWSYIQKQEETVRGFEHMLDSLLRACHMKADVLEWCKAEGHVGEMSDGEDWYDREKWGLAEGEDLKKGTDEDDVETVDESRTTAKRGRGRRQ